MKLFDTHCHLDLLFQSDDFADKIAPNWLDWMHENNVHSVTQIGTNLASSQFAADLPYLNREKPTTSQHVDNTYSDNKYGPIYEYFQENRFNEKLECYYTIGLHPCSHAEAEFVPQLTELARQRQDDHRFVAVGEIGLDYYWENEKRVIENQQNILKHFLGLALELDRSVVIHSRDAFEDTYNILKEHHNGNGIIHCFTGDADWAVKFVELGYHISFSGIVTFKNAKDIQAAAEAIPVEKMLIETDSPYLAPVPKRGKTNNPAYVKHTLEYIAKLRGMDANDLNEVLSVNANRVFKIPTKKEQ